MTGRATGLAALVLAGAAVGVALGWAEVVAVVVALLAVAASALLMRLPATATWADVSAPHRVTRGDAAAVVIRVVVPSGPTTWVSAVDGRGTGRTWLPTAATDADLTWPIDTSRRGQYDVGPARLEAGDPFGLRHRVLADREPTPVLVVPRVHAVAPEGSRGSTDDGASDERLGSDQFHSLREYVVGDPMKLVHWPTTARVGKLMVRRTVETTVPWLLLVLDVNERAYDAAGAIFEDFDDEAFEQSVDTSASWAWWACGPRQRVLLTTTAMTTTTVEVTTANRESALDMLAVVTPAPSDECGAARVTALARRHGVGRIVLVTGRRTETSAAWLTQWSRLVPASAVVGHS